MKKNYKLSSERRYDEIRDWHPCKNDIEEVSNRDERKLVKYSFVQFPHNALIRAELISKRCVENMVHIRINSIEADTPELRKKLKKKLGLEI